jgi:TP53 regulating kinase-like protein
MSGPRPVSANGKSSYTVLPFKARPDWTMISQGAEARLWKIPKYDREDTNNANASSPFPTQTVIAVAKERFSKSYRHKILDERLTKHRCRAEARILEKCLKKGMSVPLVYRTQGSVLYLEFIEGPTVRDYLHNLLHQDGSQERVKNMAQYIGDTVGTLHGLGVIHGDLTTSNMMVPSAVVSSSDASVVLTLIDFGLAKNTESAEERAVDLYVLERALTSTHPTLPDDFFDLALQAYAVAAAASKCDATLTRLEQVRQRGRKRECFG